MVLVGIALLIVCVLLYMWKPLKYTFISWLLLLLAVFQILRSV